MLLKNILNCVIAIGCDFQKSSRVTVFFIWEKVFQLDETMEMKKSSRAKLEKRGA